MASVRLIFSILTVCLFATGPSWQWSAPKSILHAKLRRALTNGQTPIDIESCNDHDQCDILPDVCTSDPEIARVLCPLKCGACVCEDSSATEGKCYENVPEVCLGEFASSLCPKTCGVCGRRGSSCFDHVNCADLQDPCNNAVGYVACSKYCGFCKDDKPTTTTTATSVTTVSSDKPTTTTTATSVTTVSSDACVVSPCLNGGICQNKLTTPGYECFCSSPYSGTVCQINGAATTTDPSTGSGDNDNCTNILNNQTELPCQEAEIVFLVEYGYKDSTYNIDHEGDFIKELVDGWKINDSGIRFGVVIYHDTVSEAIHITDYANDSRRLKDKITSLTRRLRPSGSADLGQALDYARTHSFTNARPGVRRVVIPIVHQMSSSTKDKIIPAAEKLKDDCVSIVGIVVQDSTVDYDLMHKTVSQPYNAFYSSYRSYNDLENAGKYIHYYASGCQVSSTSKQAVAAVEPNTTLAPSNSGGDVIDSSSSQTQGHGHSNSNSHQSSWTH